MIMPFEGTHYPATDVSPYLAAMDEATYVEAILPLLAEIPTPPVSEPMPWDHNTWDYIEEESPYGP